MKRRFEQFMRGRYGTDELSRCILVICMGLLVLNLFLRSQASYVIVLVLLGISYYRMFSRNIAQRSHENSQYLSWTDGIRRRVRRMWSRVVQSRNYHIYKCPSCGQKIRIPRGKGKICITCPKCRHEFEKRS